MPALKASTTDYLLYFFITAHLLDGFMLVFTVYSMFYHDGICLSCVSCNKRFTYLLTYYYYCTISPDIFTSSVPQNATG